MCLLLIRFSSASHPIFIHFTTYIELTVFSSTSGDISKVNLMRRSLLKNLCNRCFISSSIAFGIDPANFYLVPDLPAFELEGKIGITRHRSTKVHMQHRPTIACTAQGLYEMRSIN
jgi:hypothetical protein